MSNAGPGGTGKVIEVIETNEGDELQLASVMGRIGRAASEGPLRAPGGGRSSPGTGVLRSLPAKREYSRNASLTSTHTVWDPVSWSLVLQHPSLKNPVTGSSLHGNRVSPKTLRDSLISIVSTVLLLQFTTAQHTTHWFGEGHVSAYKMP